MQLEIMRSLANNHPKGTYQDPGKAFAISATACLPAITGYRLAISGEYQKSYMPKVG